jgi:hypothetical protein
MWKSIENCILISENKIQNTKYKIILSNIILLHLQTLYFAKKSNHIQNFIFSLLTNPDKLPLR